MTTSLTNRNSLLALSFLAIVLVALGLIGRLNPITPPYMTEQIRFFSDTAQVATTSGGNKVTICPDGKEFVYIKKGDVPCDQPEDYTLMRYKRHELNKYGKAGTIGRFLEEIFQLRASR